MPRRVSVATARCAALAFVALLAALTDVTSTLAQAEHVRFCFSPWPPYAHVQDGEATGVSIEILREAARRARLEASFHEYPWKRCLHLVTQGELDAVVVTSGEGLRNLFELLGASAAVALRGASLIVGSERTAAQALALGVRAKPRVARRTDDAAMLVALEEHWTEMSK